MSDIDNGAAEGTTDQPQKNTDDFKGLVVSTNGEKVNLSEEPRPEAETPAEVPKEEVKYKRPGRWERQLARQAAELEAVKAELAKVKAPVNSDEPNGPPKEEDFESVLDYLDAKQDWKVEQALKKNQETVEKSQGEQAKQLELQKKVEAFQIREAKILEENPDYGEKIAELIDDGFINKPMMEAIFDSDIGEKVSLHLANNPQEAMLISKLEGPQLYKVMGMLEAKLSSAAPPPERQTKATAPIAPVRSNPATNASQDPTKMTLREFDKWMKA